MRFLGRVIAAFFMLFCAVGADAAVKIYLFSRADIIGEKITMADIGTVEARDGLRQSIEALEIGPSLLKDGLIGKDEVACLVEAMVNEKPVIFGSAVRVLRSHDREPSAETEEESEELIQKGAPVRVFYSLKGISIETGGIAMEKGKAGEMIQVKVKGRAMSARIIDRYRVRKEL